MSGYTLKLVKSVPLHTVFVVCERLSRPFIIGGRLHEETLHVSSVGT